MGLFDRVRSAFQKTRNALGTRIAAVLVPGRKLDADLLGELEDILLTADVGMDATDMLLEGLKEAHKDDGGKTPPEQLLRQQIVSLLKKSETECEMNAKPYVILVIGVNGTGKTTTIGKLGRHYRQQGRSVMLAAADTFRAAAIDQLKIWGERIDAPVISGQPGGDSAAVAYDALAAAKSRSADVLLVDTAGRLHNKANLMRELEKISRVLNKCMEGTPHEILLVLDATTGQNGVVQASEFTKAAGITGLVLTKVDGTAKGGVILAISQKLGVPIRYVGFGEGTDDLAPFDATVFADSLLGEPAAESTDAASDNRL